nr:hypothetical protein [uncultured Allomuricauda sp.]
MKRERIIEVFQKWNKDFNENREEYRDESANDSLEYAENQADHFLELYNSID